MLNSKCNIKIQLFHATVATRLFTTEPRAEPALCLRSVLGDLPVEPVNGSVEILAGLTGELLATNPGLIPLLLGLDAQGIVLCLSLGAVFLCLVLRLTAVLLGLVLCLLSVSSEVRLGLLRLGAGAVGLLVVSTSSSGPFGDTIELRHDVRSLGRLRERPRSPPRRPSWPPCPGQGGHHGLSWWHWRHHLVPLVVVLK